MLFLEGNPDRPLITGVVYNATNTVPNTLPDKKVLTTSKSNSSKGGGGYNELTFDDTKSSEMVTFQAQYNYSKKVLNNETVEITQDTTTTVDKGNRSVTVTQGNDTHTVTKGNREVTVSQGNDTHTVSTGNRSATISTGNESLTVSAGNLTLSVSAGGSTTTTGQAFGGDRGHLHHPDREFVDHTVLRAEQHPARTERGDDIGTDDPGVVGCRDAAQRRRHDVAVPPASSTSTDDAMKHQPRARANRQGTRTACCGV